MSDKYIRNRLKTLSAFTLIELLIVVAIIAILAAIAVPNFLEAQTRAKIARNKADMRTCTTALETYRIDWNKFPVGEHHENGWAWQRPGTAHVSWPFHNWVPSRVTTPVAYMSSLPLDPFDPQSPVTPVPAVWENGKLYRRLVFRNMQHMKSRTNYQLWYTHHLRVAGEYSLFSNGPDKSFYNPPLGGGTTGGNQDARSYIDYDATNGTISVGNIIRSEKNGDRFGMDQWFASQW